MTPSTLPGRLVSMPYALLLPLLPLAVLCTLGFLYSAPHYRIPEQIPYWAFFFGLPHILSSFQTMCDAEYLAAYRKQALFILCLFFLPFALYKMGVPASIILTVFLVLTVHHVIAQQYGIALSVARLRPSPASAICKWCTVLLGTVAYFQCYSAADLRGSEHYGMLITLADALMMPLLMAIAVAGTLLVWQARAQRMGAVLLALTILLFIFALMLIFKTQHMLVGLMLARILHDVSGFVVYIGHDTARNRIERKNLLYRVFPFLPVWFLNLSFALAIAAGLTWLSSGMAFIGWLVIGISTAHYYMESFIWRGGTPHRQHFRLSGA
jgi:hypothetical protein